MNITMKYVYNHLFEGNIIHLFTGMRVIAYLLLTESPAIVGDEDNDNIIIVAVERNNKLDITRISSR